jgi:putative ABC transport system permease protein
LTPAVGEAFRSFGLTLTVRTKSDPHGAVSAVTDAIHQVGPDIPVTDVLSMDDVIAQSMSPQRFNMVLLAAFAGLALLLAAVGIYGVLSYSVRRRVREIGIRMALGASQSNILRLVVGDGMKPILIGVAIGLTAAVALSRFMASLVFGVPPTDPLTFTVVALLLVVVGIVANTLPAYRATRVEPVRTLREE